MSRRTIGKVPPDFGDPAPVKFQDDPSGYVTSYRTVVLESGGTLKLKLLDAFQLTMSPEDRAFLEALLRMIESYEQDTRRPPAPPEAE